MSLRQTQPAGGVPVCLNDTVVFTCEATTELFWRDLATNYNRLYFASTSVVGDTGDVAIFRTNLTANDGTRLTSTATVNNVQLEYAGRRISCRETNMGVTNEEIVNLTVAGN